MSEVFNISNEIFKRFGITEEYLRVLGIEKIAFIDLKNNNLYNYDHRMIIYTVEDTQQVINGYDCIMEYFENLLKFNT